MAQVGGQEGDAPGAPLTGIGRAKALQIWYRALSVYVTSTANCKGARSTTRAAAADLSGSASAEYARVAAAGAAADVN